MNEKLIVLGMLLALGACATRHVNGTVTVTQNGQTSTFSPDSCSPSLSGRGVGASVAGGGGIEVQLDESGHEPAVVYVERAPGAPRLLATHSNCVTLSGNFEGGGPDPISGTLIVDCANVDGAEIHAQVDFSRCH